MSGVATVGVVGLGTMGAGIVEVFAKAGLAVVAVEINDEALGRGRTILERSTGRALERGRLSEADHAALLERVSWTTSFDDLAPVDLVIEAIPERMDLKRDLFARLDGLCQPSTILATNTSSLSVTAIAATTSRPERIVGMHFFNPAPAMKLVEVITTVLTDSEVEAAIRELATSCGKAPVVVGDRAGFVANTLLIGYLNEAVRLFDEKVVDRDGLDAAMRLGAGLPMGPLALCDLIGLDVVLEIVDVLFAESRDPVHAAPPVLRAMVAAGLLGRKSGRGFYTYEAAGSGRVVADDSTLSVVPDDAKRTVCVVPLSDHINELRESISATASSVTETTREELSVGNAEVILVEVSPLHRLTDVTARLGDAASRAVGVHPLHRREQGMSVEVVTTGVTSDAAVATALAVVDGAQGTPTVCHDVAGLVIGRLLTVYLNDAVRMVASGYASPDDVDAAMRWGCGYPMGPVAFADMMGAKSIVDTLECVHDSTRLARHAPVPLLRDAASLGRGVRALVSANA